VRTRQHRKEEKRKRKPSPCAAEGENCNGRVEVRETGGEFWVVKPDGLHLAGPFETNAAAWSRINRKPVAPDVTPSLWA
jgi:hypothetical protein